ncbi:MAG: hypothetical protein HeimC2_01620 [Candidatus Heimdallarchaeota archaeon LC_2]|nr:MAG: hypothetical protein HeimC2_01620 [Candidatus Heimdallarchaeota archaeon LC_2]
MVHKKYVASAIILTIIIGFNLYIANQTQKDVIVLATTTSVENSGLLDILIPVFENQYGVNVKVIARGSGVAADLAKNGEVDAILIHAPSLEDELINSGYGVNKTTLWFNFFVIVGPSKDPANVSMSSSAREAFVRIYTAGENKKIEFYSRGDLSGTHIKEMEIWENSSLRVSAEDSDWYLETGTGMASTLTISAENNGYTLSDMGTYLQLKENANIKSDIIFDGDQILYNPYSYLIVSPIKFPDRNKEFALLFLEFLLKNSTMELVSNYKIAGKVLFTPISSK